MLPTQKDYIIKVPKKTNSKKSKNSLLDNTSITCRWASNKKKVKARFWNRILSFITRLNSHKLKGYMFSFLTLTSSPKSKNDRILNHWNVLKKRIERKYGKVYAFVVREYNKEATLIHLHILFYAPYIPVNWLSTSWNDIHKAKIVYIEGIKEGKLKSKVLGYMAKYISKTFNKNDPSNYPVVKARIRRFSYSHFFPKISLLWKKYSRGYINIYGKNLPDMIKWWNYFITKYDTWNIPTLFRYLLSI